MAAAAIAVLLASSHPVFSVRWLHDAIIRILL